MNLQSYHIQILLNLFLERHLLYFEISVRNYKFKKIHTKYSDIVNFTIDENKRNNDGQALAIFNSSSNSEILSKFVNERVFTWSNI